MDGNKRVEQEIVEINGIPYEILRDEDGNIAEVNETRSCMRGPVILHADATAATPIGEVFYLTMPSSFPDTSLSDKPKRPKRTWPGQGDDRARNGRNQNRSGRRRR